VSPAAAFGGDDDALFRAISAELPAYQRFSRLVSRVTPKGQL
jgi:hypothetical protein